ncbi:hypothetical protein [Paradevosia shaoguanensis]|uniref:Uncharacterized protein n=1 Tax=Paradevosia shaoguanensis TaxID=1335043 RepID=A0AA41QPN6_9HYPH|nr:hypothetical protein [Paradevosia shaoguanensis]MCF1744233.1 hypothetical protein [Paradevosia shaoguanensis]MCI0128716.1 hypothetical protein [Paradevosia shaoguanensis]
MIHDFEDDGCTFWFDFWRGIDLRRCCDVHDAAYAQGHTVIEWFSANMGLLGCGIINGAPDWAVLAFLGVCSPVAAFLFFRGKKKS